MRKRYRLSHSEKSLNAKKRREEKRKADIWRCGGKCVMCGFSDWRALEFDHKNGNPSYRKCGSGARPCDRGSSREFNKRRKEGSLLVYYQLLCANCHAIKTFGCGDHKPNGSGNGAVTDDCQTSLF